MRCLIARAWRGLPVAGRQSSLRCGLPERRCRDAVLGDPIGAGQGPFTPSSAPICFSSHLMVSDTGIVTTISLASFCGSASRRMRTWSGVISPGSTVGRAPGMRPRVWISGVAPRCGSCRFRRLAGLAERLWERMDSSFQSVAWRRWVRQLPEAVLRARPVLCVQYAWALLDAGEVEASEARLRDAERAMASLATRPSCRMRRRSR